MGNAHRSMAAMHGSVQAERAAQVEDLNAVDDFGYTLLLFAARDGDMKTVRFLLENNASVDVSNGYGATALHFAASWGQRDVARVLLKHGASVNATDSSGKTPLLRAAANGDAKLVRLLLKYGADASIRDSFGWNAERLAGHAGHYKVVATLRYYDNRASTVAQRRSSRPRSFFSAISLLPPSEKTPRRSQSPFPTVVIEPAAEPRRNVLKPLRPCPYSDSR